MFLNDLSAQKDKFFNKFKAQERKYLVFGFLAIFAFVTIIYLGPLGGLDRFGLVGQKKDGQKSLAATDFDFSLGGESEVFPGIQLGSFPDTHIAFRNLAGFAQMWMSAEVRSYYFRGPTLETVQPHQKDANNNPVPVLRPTGPGTGNFDDEYAGFGSVFEGPVAGRLIGIYHGEKCGRGNYTATVGLVTSVDNGVTWTNRKAIIKGYQGNESCTKTRPSGAGQPDAIKIGDYIYVYYTQWGGGQPDQIQVARVPFAQVEDPNAYRKYFNGAWNEPGLGGNSTPVILPPTGGVYAANADVSWNNYLNSYIAVNDSSAGFYLRTSTNGINWDTPRLIFAFPQRHDQVTNGSIWFNYPTLLSPSTSSDTITNQTGYLYYSKGQIGVIYHKLFKKPFNFTIIGTPPPSPPPSPTPTPMSTPSPTASISADVVAPTVAITSPADGSIVARRSTLTISADASDNVGVTKVEFYVNNTQICVANTAPYNCDYRLSGKPNASYTLTAKAYDAAANSASSSISITASSN